MRSWMRLRTGTMFGLLAGVIPLSGCSDSEKPAAAASCSAVVTEVAVSPGKRVGELVTFDVNGSCFKPGMAEDGISVTVAGCEGQATTAYADTKVSYRCTPSVSGNLPGAVKSQQGATIHSFVVPVLPSDPPDAGTDTSTGGLDGGNASVCPSGNGDYCGSAALGQNTGSLYTCTGGVYTLKTDCSGLGCQLSGVEQNDTCNTAVDSGTGGSGIEGQSCNGMAGTECQGKSCCSNLLVPGSTFPMGRSASGTDAYSGIPDEQPEHNATVADFYLDEYEVTVGRFRKFVQQYDGTPPQDGAAAHPLIAGSGWQSAWNTDLASSQATLISNLKCSAYQTWRDTASGTEVLPINCVNWYEAFAFCAWDGGRLPTEAEWEYAAAGAHENRLYPWGSAAPDNTLAAYGCLYSGLSSCAFEDVAAVGALPYGAGRWGHRDLAGNMSEWALDGYSSSWYSGAGGTCDNCANLTNAFYRVYRGGRFSSHASDLRAAYRNGINPGYLSSGIGFRCARTP